MEKNRVAKVEARVARVEAILNIEKNRVTNLRKHLVVFFLGLFLGRLGSGLGNLNSYTASQQDDVNPSFLRSSIVQEKQEIFQQSKKNCDAEKESALKQIKKEMTEAHAAEIEKLRKEFTSVAEIISASTTDVAKALPVEQAVASTSSTTNEQQSLVLKSILNNPSIDQSKGTLTTPSSLSLYEDLVKPNRVGAVDDEKYRALASYFWGKENGIVIELGGLDGDYLSESQIFNKKFNWHRLLIEANPSWAEQGPIKSPDATYVHGAICSDEGVVHYIKSGGSGAMNGIAEFMTPEFLKKYHPQVYGATYNGTNFAKVSNWSELGQDIQEVPCVRLQSILNTLTMKHVNFFILDVEGGELNILQGMDWNKDTGTKFDVITVETRSMISDGFRQPGYPDQVKEFLTSKGYLFEFDEGRNSWFRHPDFIPSSKPGESKSNL